MSLSDLLAGGTRPLSEVFRSFALTRIPTADLMLVAFEGQVESTWRHYLSIDKHILQQLGEVLKYV